MMPAARPSLCVVVLVDVAQLPALGRHLGEQTAPRPRLPQRAGPRLGGRDRGRLGLELRLVAADPVADHDARRELVEVRLQLLLEAAPQHLTFTPTQPPVLCGTENECWPERGNVLRLGNRGRMAHRTCGSVLREQINCQIP